MFECKGSIYFPGDPSEGIEMQISMKRRIISELLTTYLPSLLILAIVYATNFFKPFFFESVVSTNLTSQLVLTTLFISVSQSLPPTAYVKMIDVWLIFSQLIPFVEVLLHTYMDSLREDEDREINHHGTPLEVSTDSGKAAKEENELFHKKGAILMPEPEMPTLSKMVAKNEKEQMKARKQFYDKAKVNKSHLNTCENIAKKGIPALIIIFSIIYWTYGLYFYFSN